MFGIQWDLICKFLEIKGNSTISDINSDSSTWGNYSNVIKTISSSKAERQRAEFMTEKKQQHKKKRGKVQHIRGSPKKRKISGKAVFSSESILGKMLADVKNLITDKASELKRADQKKLFLANFPYLMFAYFFNKIAWLYRVNTGATSWDKFMNTITYFELAFQNLWPSLNHIDLLCGIFWHSIFYQKEKKLLNRLQQMLDCAIDGELERTEISEEKYSALENSMKQHLDSSFLARKNQQEQKEVIQKLISDIAHQTLTPISNLKIYGEILSETNHENQEEIDTILEQTEKLDFLIQSLVKLSRMESGIIAVHSEDTTIKQMLESIQQQFNVKVREKNITLSLCDTDLHVLCDPKWTVEALGNIVDNAIKYTACGGNVQVKAEQNSFFVKIDIIDDGIGIEKEEIPKIFGRFYRSLSVADQPGVGIGLFLAREIIQAQKGYIKVTSKRGKGSTFSVFLPIAKKE